VKAELRLRPRASKKDAACKSGLAKLRGAVQSIGRPFSLLEDAAVRSLPSLRFLRQRLGVLALLGVYVEALEVVVAFAKVLANAFQQ